MSGRGAGAVGWYAQLWSGGKDSLLALARARDAGLHVRRLVTFHDGATGRVRLHGVPVGMLRAQAQALGVELVPIGAPLPLPINDVT